GRNELKYDPLQFTWLGSMNREATLAMSWHTSKGKTHEDLKKTELLVPGTGAGADSEIIPHAFNNLAGTKFKIIAGYKDTTEGALAMERGELDGLAYWSWSAIMAAHPDWVPEKKVNVLFHTGTEPIPEIRDVPLIRNLVTNPTDKKALEFMLAREISAGRSWRLRRCLQTVPPCCAPPSLPHYAIRSLSRTPSGRTLRPTLFRARKWTRSSRRRRMRRPR